MFGWFQRLLPKKGDFFGLFEAHAATLVEAAAALREMAEDGQSPQATLTAVHDHEHRPFRRGDEAKVSIWPVTLTVAEPLPVLPLWLRGVEEPVRVDLEAAYTEARQRSALR